MLFVICFSCGKDNKRYEGEATALMNGEDWKAISIVLPNTPLDNYFEIYLKTLDNFGDTKERLNVFKIPYETGKYYLHDTNGNLNDSLSGASYTTFLEGDQLTGAWGIEGESDSSNYIDITYYDESTGEVEGIFNCTLVGNTILDTGPDTIRFTDGWFEGRINEDD